MPLRNALVKVEYFFSSVLLGVEIFFQCASLNEDSRKLAQDMRASMHGELRDEISVNTIHRIDHLCGTMRKAEKKWGSTNSVIRFIIEPMRRNMVENREILEEVAVQWRRSEEAKRRTAEQGPAAA